MYKLDIETDFSAAHNLRGYEGKCENLHGHNYRVKVRISGSELDNTGMLADFKVLKKIIEEVAGRLDHAYLNEVEPFNEVNPTAENIARVICEGVQRLLPEGLKASAVWCWESDRCSAGYFPDEKS